VLAAQLGRDAGKRKEPLLFDSWGGAPTTVLLRHRSHLNPVLRRQYHRRLSSLTEGSRYPTPAQEANDPAAADAVYEASVRALRERTRDKRRFPLVFEEVCNYGFRRNLWAHRGLGIALSLMSLVIATAAVLILPPAPFVAVIVVDIVALIVWTRVVTRDWVREAAFAYAEQLLASTEGTSNGT